MITTTAEDTSINGVSTSIREYIVDLIDSIDETDSRYND
jgi:hypothetical protein